MNKISKYLYTKEINISLNKSSFYIKCILYF